MGLKVLMIGPYPLEPGTVEGGIESVTSTLVPALAEQEEIDSVTVLRFHHGEAPTDYRREGPKVEVRYVRGQDRWRTITGSYLDVRQARRLTEELRPDIVHGQEIGWNGDIATKCSPNCVVTVHGMPHVEIRLSAQSNIRDRWRIKPIDAMVRRVLRRAKVVISISKYDADRLASNLCGTRVSIANPIGPEFFSLAPPRETEPRLLFAGVLTPRKNPIGLVGAFARARSAVPNARLVLAGSHPDPTYTERVLARISRLHLEDSVEILGLIDKDRLRHEISMARAVVLFSRQETAPTIIGHAMAAGKPVVATDVGGVTEMVSDGQSGYVVASEEEAALTDRLVELLEDQELCLRMGACAHELASERFTPQVIARQTVQAYKTALN
jgi:glycosyltransferase involved in cell wall biosynthesis